jgi:hypothetical protein
VIVGATLRSGPPGKPPTLRSHQVAGGVLGQVIASGGDLWSHAPMEPCENSITVDAAPDPLLLMRSFGGYTPDPDFVERHGCLDAFLDQVS